VDALGMLLAVVITAASVQDRDAARPLLWNLHRACRPIRLIWADAVYTGKLSGWAASLKMAICIMAGRNPHALRGAAPPVGCGADVRLDQQSTPHHLRLRAPPGQPRSHGLVGHDRPDDPAAWPSTWLSLAVPAGHQNQGAASGPTKIEGGPAGPWPERAGRRYLRGGNANAARDAAGFAAEVGAVRAEDARAGHRAGGLGCSGSWTTAPPRLRIDHDVAHPRRGR
jgi:hypothetical protein